MKTKMTKMKKMKKNTIYFDGEIALGLKEALGYIEVNAETGVVQGHTVPLGEVDWFSLSFPPSLELRHSLEVFKFLSSSSSSPSSSLSSPPLSPSSSSSSSIV